MPYFTHRLHSIEPDGQSVALLIFGIRKFLSLSFVHIGYAMSILLCAVNASLQIVDRMCTYIGQLLTNGCPYVVPRIPAEIREKKPIK